MLEEHLYAAHTWFCLFAVRLVIVSNILAVVAHIVNSEGSVAISVTQFVAGRAITYLNELQLLGDIFMWLIIVDW